MIKYRIKLLTGRVIGPFTQGQVEELAIKNKIDGSEDFQVFPAGDWKGINAFESLQAAVKNVKSEAQPDPTFIKKLSQIDFSNTQDEPEIRQGLNTAQMRFPKEFSFELENEAPITEEKNVPGPKVEKNEDDFEKTRIVTKLQDLNNAVNEDKTQINPDTKKYLEELKKQKEKNQAEQLAQKNSEAQAPPEINLDTDSTQFFDLKEVQKEIKEEVKVAESDFASEKEIVRIEKTKKDLEERIQVEDVAEPESAEDLAQKAKKKNIIIIAIAILVVFFLMGEDEKPIPKEVKILDAQILFPQRYDIPSEQKALEFYKLGNEAFDKGTYTDRLKAAILFRNSAENKFEDNKGVARLIYAYSSVLENSNTFEESASKIFKLVQITKTKGARDPLFAAAIAKFYYAIGKFEASVNMVEKFNILKVNNPTTELYSVYLDSLLKTGDMIKALEVAKKLSGVKNKSYDVYNSLFDYYYIKGDYNEASSVISQALSLFPQNVGLLLKKDKLLVYKEDFESLKKDLLILRKLEVENSKIYYSKYHELKALYFVSKGEVDKAVESFKQALKLHESMELRSKLALLDQSTNGQANKLILESKAIKLIKDSQDHMKKNNWKFAFKDALEATRVAEQFIPAQINLTQLQIKQGFFSEALETLNKLFKDNPSEPNIAFSLVDAYVESYKFGSAKSVLEAIGSGELRSDPRYYSMTAKFYIYKNDFSSSIAWLTSAINRNPVDDHNIYELAKVFIQNRKYNKAKILLGKAQDLDPINLDYRVSYAQILYEMDGADSAIGYLYSVLKDFPDDAKLLSSVGIFYYKSGQVKMFKSVKEKILSLTNKSTALFEFLIHAAKMEENVDEVVSYSKQLIDINPGDLRARLFLAKVYIELYKYKEAFKELESIQSRLETYPKLQYYLSKLYLLTDNIPKAQELSEKEIKSNPNNIDGYILMAQIKANQKKYSESEKYYKMAQRIDAKNVDVLMGLAFINAKKSQYEISLDLYKKARTFDPSNVEVHRELADVYRKVGQSALAIESYQVYLELFPNSKYKQTIESYINMMQ